MGFAVAAIMLVCAAGGYLLWQQMKRDEQFMRTLYQGGGWPPMPKPLPPPPPPPDQNMDPGKWLHQVKPRRCARCAKGAAHCREEKAV